MEVIRVPVPPKEAFNKLRPMSDLIKAQVKHFKHLEEKFPAEKRQTIPQHRITTENDAALYIAAMTRLLRSDLIATPAKQKTVAIREEKPAAASPAAGLAIAASGSDAPKPSGESKSKSAPRKKK